MSLLILAKIVHILTATFFISVVAFRTFITPAVKEKLGKEIYLNVQNAMGTRARTIIKINNVFLILSGLYLFTSYLGGLNILLHIKALLGLVLAFLFYIVPFIMKKYKYITWFNTAFHHIFFTLMVVTVILSQIMFA